MYSPKSHNSNPSRRELNIGRRLYERLVADGDVFVVIFLIFEISFYTRGASYYLDYIGIEGTIFCSEISLEPT
jgi:hypothetical protein